MNIISNSSVPIVSGMSGNIAPDSFGMRLAYDFRLATEKTTFIFPTSQMRMKP